MTTRAAVTVISGRARGWPVKFNVFPTKWSELLMGEDLLQNLYWAFGGHLKAGSQQTDGSKTLSSNTLPITNTKQVIKQCFLQSATAANTTDRLQKPPVSR